MKELFLQVFDAQKIIRNVFSFLNLYSLNLLFFFYYLFDIIFLKINYMIIY